MGGSIADWPRLLKKAYDSLRPGGWIEITEFDAWMSTDDDSLPKDSSIWEWINKLDEGAKMFGKTMNIAKQFKSLVEEAGFESIEETQFKVCQPTLFILNKKLISLGTFIAMAQGQATEGAVLVHAAVDARLSGALQHGIVHASARMDARAIASPA